jgi:hypothetical protein
MMPPPADAEAYAAAGLRRQPPRLPPAAPCHEHYAEQLMPAADAIFAGA